MHRFKLSFRDKPLKVFQFEHGEIAIGSDPQCEIVIENLAVQPVHARVLLNAETVRIRAAEQDAQILLNNRPLEDTTDIHHGDVILIGKHTLTYQEVEHAAFDDSQIVRLTPDPAFLQYMSGPKFGRTMKLGSSYTRIGKQGKQCGLISCRPDGYYLAHLEGDQQTRLNSQPVDATGRKLANGDTIEVGPLKLLFFIEDRVADKAHNHHASR